MRWRCDAQGDVPGALSLYRRALECRERLLGLEHPDTHTSMNNVAGCLFELGDPAAAVPLYQGALDGCERLLGEDHPTTQTIRRNLEIAKREAARRAMQEEE